MAPIRVFFVFFLVLTFLSTGTELRGATHPQEEKGILSESAVPMQLAAQEPATPGGSSAYTSVAPIFEKHCVMCHTGPKAPHGLRLDSYQNVMAGGDNGPVVVPRDPAKSEIIKRVKGISKPRMPMNGPPWLSDNEVAAIENWIKAGAPDGGSAAIDEKGRGVTEPTAKVSDKAQPVTYADVSSIFNTRCVKCHTQNSLMGAPPEGVRLDSYEAVLRSSERPVVIPGAPGASLLVRAIRGQSQPRMPFDGPPYLDDAEIDLIARWVAEGARDNNGNKAPVPAGARIRLEGRLTQKWALDGTALIVGRGTRIDKSPSVGDYVEVRGVIGEDGAIHAHRIRRR